MTHTDQITIVAKEYERITLAAQEELGIADVFYGDQIKIPRTPSVVIEPADKRRELRNAPRGTLNTMQVYILIYHCEIQDNQITRLEADQLAEALETVYHRNVNKNLGGLVMHQYVVRSESGYRNRADSKFITTRLTVEAESLTQLPYQ